MFFFESKRSGYLLKERSYIATGPFNLAITPTCLILVAIITALYASIWMIESNVLMTVFGFEMPFFIKLSSIVSTALLYTIIFKSVAMIYMLMVSCLLYIIFHTMIFGFLLQVYLSTKIYAEPLYSLIYYETGYTMFHIFLTLCMLRIIMTFPLLYYIMVLAIIRINGGNGWERKTAFELERMHMSEQMDTMKLRSRYLEKRAVLLELEEAKSK